MKKILVFSLFLLLSMSFIAGAQDVIYKTNGSKEEAKILLVGDKEIQYKKFNNPEGPVYSINKSEITMITYENGEFEMMKSQTSVAKSNKQELATNFAKNLLTYHLFDVVYGDFTISYERILSSGTIGISIPIGLGYAYNSEYPDNSQWIKSKIYSGIGVNFYPTGQGKWRYFLGPKVRIGYGKQSDVIWYYDQNGDYQDEEVDNEGIYTKFIVDNGVMFTPVRNLSISTVVGVGVRLFPEASEDSHNVVMPTAYFSVNLSYRF